MSEKLVPNQENHLKIGTENQDFLKEIPMPIAMVHKIASGWLNTRE